MLEKVDGKRQWLWSQVIKNATTAQVEMTLFSQPARAFKPLVLERSLPELQARVLKSVLCRKLRERHR